MVKQMLFTLPGLLVTVIHDLILVGILATFVWFQVQVLGNDVIVNTGPKSHQR